MSEGHWCYIAINPCGCATGAVIDSPESPQLTADSVAEFVRSGRRVERRWVDADSPAPIVRCKCGEQMSLEAK